MPQSIFFLFSIWYLQGKYVTLQPGKCVKQKKDMLKPYKIFDYQQEYQPTWCCPMPKGCPPDEVLVPFKHLFYRLAKHKDAFCDEDFMSYAEINPQRHWGDLLPLAVGLSLIDNEEKARKNLKLPIFRQYKGIIALSLKPTDGVVKQTGIHRSHYTWWRTTAFTVSNLSMLQL